MSLRKKKGVYFDLTLPDVEKKVKYRSFTVGETKEILTAKALEDPGAFVNTLLKCIAAAVEGVDVDKLPMYLVDFLFLKIYAKSGGNKINVRYTCPAEECDHSMNLQLDLDRIEIQKPADFLVTKLIDLGDDMTIKLRIPNFEALRNLKIEENKEADLIDKFIFSGIECVTDGDAVKVPGIDFTEEELIEWVNDLDGGVLKDIESFFEQFPEVVLNTKIKCPKCSFEDEYTIRGIDYFLA